MDPIELQYSHTRTTKNFADPSISPPPTCFCSINAVGVDIAPFSAMPGEEEVLLLPGVPLVNRPGENPEPGLWTFEIETPGAPVSGEGDPPPVMIDYVHPGTGVRC